MKFVSRVCCLFMAFGLVGCDDPETQARSSAAIALASTDGYVNYVQPFVTECLQSFETGTVKTAAMTSAGYEVTAGKNNLSFSRTITESNSSGRRVSIIGYIKNNVCDWSVSTSGDYLALAANAANVLKNAGYVEVNSDNPNVRLFRKNDLTVKLRATSVSSTYYSGIGVYMRKA